MKKCSQYSYDDLVLYKNQLLDNESEQLAVKHISECTYCRKRAEEIVILPEFINDIPREKSENHLNFIIRTAQQRQIPRKKILREILDEINGFISKGKILLRGLLIQPAAVALALVCLLLFLLISGKKENKYYFTRVSGEVMVNKQDFFRKNNYKHDLKIKMKIETGQGHCIVQIRKEKVFSLAADTRLDIRYDKNIYVNLQKGRLASWVKKRTKEKLIINTDTAQYTVIGTKFALENMGAEQKLQVWQGLIQVDYNGRRFSVSSNQEIIIDKSRSRVSRKEISARDKNNSADLQAVDDLSGKRLLALGSKAGAMEIFEGHEKLGNTPYFCLTAGDNKNIYISRKGYQTLKLKKDGPYINKDIELDPYNTLPLLWSKKYSLRNSRNPVILGRNILIQRNNGSLIKTAMDNNKLLWQLSSDSAFYSSLAVHDNRVYFISRDGLLYSVDYRTGKILWTCWSGLLNEKQIVFSGKNVYFANQDGFLYCVNKDNGYLQWRKIFPAGIASSLIHINRKLFFIDQKGTLYAIEAETRDIIWKKDIDQPQQIEMTCLENNLYYFDHNLLICCSPDSGKIIWQKRINSGTEMVLFSQPGKILFKSGNTVYCFSSGSGDNLWQFQCRSPISEAVSIPGKEYILVQDKDNNYYLINSSGLLMNKWQQKSTVCRITGDDLILFNNTGFYAYQLHLE